MSMTPAPHPSRPSKDEEYWQALFDQEELIAPSTTPDTAEPPPTHLHLNGRSLPPSIRPLPPSKTDPWQTATTMQQEDECLVLTVAGYNKGGLLVYWEGLQGFVPASQLIDFPELQMNHDRDQLLKSWLNREISVKIIEVNRTNNRLILSERAALTKADERDTLFQQLSPGDTVEGEVTNLTDFGAFVDVGGVEGLIHISELSWSRVTHPSQILKPKQSVKCKVLDIHPGEGRIALSRKQLHHNPWQDVEKRYQPGQIVSGVVSNVVNFGAFIQLEQELEGLVHVSELAEGAFLHPRNVVQKGEEVQAKVLHVSGSDKRLALSMRNVDLSHT